MLRLIRKFKLINKIISLRRYLMFFKLNFLFHDFILFIYFKIFNILFTTAFLINLKDK